MEYDCVFDWEPVKLEAGVTDEVLAWLLGLKDRLTVTSQQALGEDLMVRSHLPFLQCRVMALLLCDHAASSSKL